MSKPNPSSSPLRSGIRAALLTALMGLPLALSACATDAPGVGDCSSGKCDSFDSDELANRNDPIAAYLKTLDITPEGWVDTDYKKVLFGVAEIMGCPQESIGVFTVSDDLLTDSPFPRLVSVACKDDDAKASDFFMAANFENPETGDVELRDVEMFAWDRTRREYLFYAFVPVTDDLVQLEVGPKRCEGCHLTPADTNPTGMRMTPIMNELNRPWTHWNAEPGFPSHNFSVPEGIDEKPHYNELAIGHRVSAQRFEEIVKFGGHQKVASARVRDRRNPPNLDEIMGMFRPIFCAEQINYVSEDHTSGNIFNTAFIDPGIRNMYVQIRPDNWPWAWVNDQIVRIGDPAGDTPVVQIPIRGNADATMEQQLVTTRVLTPQQVLRARALDWQNPAFSEFRCSIWKDAYERFKADPPEFGDATRNLHVMPEIFEQIMQINGNAISSGDDNVLLIVPNATPGTVQAFKAALNTGEARNGNCESDGYCAGDVDALGAMMEQYVQTAVGGPVRDTLREMRRQRVCHVLESVESHEEDTRFPDGSNRFPNRPSLPEVDCF